MDDAQGTRTAGPLADLLVVDLTRVLAGPFSTMLMADMGARVIKVERPGSGDDTRAYGPFVDQQSLYFARVNRGKESIALDLRAAADLEVLLSLVDRADVLVENFRPGVMDRLGLGYAELSARNPRLVYCSVSGFGQTGPLAGKPAYDAVVQGMSGIMSITGSPDGHPVKPGIPVADLAAGLYAFGTVMSAVHARAETGRGCRVDVAMLDSVVSLLESAALQFFATGRAPARIGNAHYSIAPFDTFATADHDITICASHDGLFTRLCEAVERPDLLHDKRFTSNDGRHRHRSELKAELEAALAVHGAGVWLDRLELAGVPCGPVRDVAEAMQSEQVLARRMVITAGGVPVPGTPMKGSAWPDPYERPGAPALDEHGEAIRAWLATDG